MTCDVCGKETKSYVYHQRLAVAVCSDCPKTNVRGEDITMHSLIWSVDDD